MTGKGERVTIADVASAAGVSKTTISRYINGKYEYMSDESRERIAAVIEELGYRPNNLARSLKSRHSHLLGVVVADLATRFAPLLLKGISECSERYDYRVMIANTDNDYRKEREYILSMADQRVDGIILNTTGHNADFLQQVHEKTGIPFVLADRMLPTLAFDTVRSDDEGALKETLLYLKQAGYEGVGFFVQSLRHSSTRVHRSKCVRTAYPRIFGGEMEICSLKEEGRDAEVVQGFLERSSGRRMAVLTVNGVVTLRVVRAMRQLGKSFPEDCGLCSFDDWDWMSLIDGGLTAVSQQTCQLGRECVKRMMYRLHRNKHAPARLIELPCELVVRHST